MGEEGKLHVQDVQKLVEGFKWDESTGPLFIHDLLLILIFFCATVIVPGGGIKCSLICIESAGGSATGCMAVSLLSGLILISPLCTQDLS